MLYTSLKYSLEQFTDIYRHRTTHLSQIVLLSVRALSLSLSLSLSLCIHVFRDEKQSYDWSMTIIVIINRKRIHVLSATPLIQHTSQSLMEKGGHIYIH